MKRTLSTYDVAGALMADKNAAWSRAGALRRLERIVITRNTRNENQVAYYHQTDPRGCALYLIKGEDITKPIEQIYYRGLAVCA
jgi:hypothetical protein